jgi:hypothetical protein
MHFSLRSLLIFVTLLTAYLGFHAWITQQYRAPSSQFARHDEPNIWRIIPKDVASLAVACYLLPLASRRRPAVPVAVAACTISVALSCIGLFSYYWSHLWFMRRDFRDSWGVMESLSWLLLLAALCFAIYAAPTHRDDER